MKSKYIPKDVNLEKEKLTNRDLIRLTKELKRENAELKNELHETHKEIMEIKKESIRCIQLHKKRLGKMFEAEKEKLEVLASNITREIADSSFELSKHQMQDVSTYVDGEIKKVQTHMDKLHDRICANEDKLKGKRIPRKAKAKTVSALEGNDAGREPSRTNLGFKINNGIVEPDDLSFVDWEHPFVQYATRLMFPGYTPEELEGVRNNVGKNVFAALILEVMGRFMNGEYKVCKRQLG